MLAVAAILLVAPRMAMAQAYYQGRSDNPVGPTVSPYLNLIGGNNLGVTNYQSLVKPLIEQGNAIQRQGNSLSNLQRQVNAQPGRVGGGSGTGHASFFMNYSHFYYNSRGGGR
jgi:hypothetical protein